MVFRRTRRVVRRRNRRVRRRMSRKRFPFGKPLFSRLARGSTVVSLSRTIERAAMQSQTSAGTGFAYSFQLSDLSNYAEFTGLFQEFRIVGIRFKIIPQMNNNPAGATTAGTTAPGSYFVVFDPDDATNPATEDTMLESEGCLIRPFYKPTTLFVKPMANPAYYDTAITTGYGMKYAPWLSTSFGSGINHYGIKVWLQQSVTNMYNIKIYATYYMQFRRTI